MLKRLNKFLLSSVIISLFMFILGIILIVFPEVSITFISYILAFMLIINGIYYLIYKDTSFFAGSFLIFGVVSLLLGIVIILNPDIVKTLFPIVSGIVMVTKSAFDMRLSLMMHEASYDNWLLIFILSIISIICGLVIIFNPGIGAIALTTSMGILISIYSISNIIDIIIFKKNINDIAKILEIK